MQEGLERGSRDTFHEKRPETNLALLPDLGKEVPSELARLNAISQVGKRPATKRIVMSAAVQRLARQVGVSSEDLADRISDDTIRRTKYPVREQQLPDGTTLFENPSGIIEGRRAAGGR